MNMGDDIDDIERAYRKAVGGEIASKEFAIVPCWWNAGDFTHEQVASMVGKAVAFAYEASAQHDPSIKHIGVDRHGIHVKALMRKLSMPRNGVSVVEDAPDGWLEDCIERLRGRMDALGRFHGQG